MSPLFTLAPKMNQFDTSERSLADVVYRYYLVHFDEAKALELRDQYINRHTLEMVLTPATDPLTLCPQVGRLESGPCPSLRELVVKMYEKFFTPEESAKLTEDYLRVLVELLEENRQYAVIVGEGEAESIYLVTGKVKALRVQSNFNEANEHAEEGEELLKVRMKAVEDVRPEPF